MTTKNPFLGGKELPLEERIKIIKRVEEDSINAERQVAEIIRTSERSVRYNVMLGILESLGYKIK